LGEVSVEDVVNVCCWWWRDIALRKEGKKEDLLVDL